MHAFDIDDDFEDDDEVLSPEMQAIADEVDAEIGIVREEPIEVYHQDCEHLPHELTSQLGDDEELEMLRQLSDAERLKKKRERQRQEAEAA